MGVVVARRNGYGHVKNTFSITSGRLATCRTVVSTERTEMDGLGEIVKIPISTLIEKGAIDHVTQVSGMIFKCV